MKLLYLLFLVVLCQTSYIPELNNINEMLLGFDTLTGDIVSYDYPVFEPFTYHENKTIILQNTLYKVPDQVFCLSDPMEQQTSTSSVYTSQMLLQESTASSSSYGYNSWFIPGMFSGNYATYQFQQTLEYEGQYSAKSTLLVTTHEVAMNANVKFSQNFLDSLRNLPDEFNDSTCHHYKEFFNIFGTHYRTKAKYGGEVEMSSRFDVSLIQTTSIEIIQQQLTEQFFLLTMTETKTTEQEQQLAELNAIYTSTFQLVGGNSSEYNATNYQPWVSSVIDNPLITSMEIHNFSSLLNHTEAFNEALTAYLYSTYIGWKVVNSVPMTKDVAVYADDNIYLPLSYEYEAYYYDMKSNLWHPMMPCPASEYADTICSTVKDIIYCFGDWYQGEYNYYTGVSYSYNTKTQIWNEIATAPMGIQSGSHTVVIGNKIYIMGGYDTILVAPWEYLPLTSMPIMVYDTEMNSYEIIDNQPEYVFDYDIVAVNDIIYIFGGIGDVLIRTMCGSYYCYYCEMLNITAGYDTKNGTWTVLASMPVLLKGFGTIVVDTKIYIIGGYIVNKREIMNEPQGIPNTIIYSYDTENNVWDIVDDYVPETASPGYAFLQDKFLYFISFTKSLRSITMTALDKFC